MRVLVFGSRHWTDREAIRRELETLPPETVIVHGAQRGADLLADEVARALGFRVEPFPADWETYGKKAGPIRNEAMLQSGLERGLCFHEDPGLGTGSRDMFIRARKAGVPVKVVRPTPSSADGPST